MNDGTTITIGLLLLVVGYIFWYFTALFQIRKASDMRIGFFMGCGLLFSTFGFGLIVDYELLNEVQMLFAFFMLLGYMMLCLLGFNSLITGNYPKD